MDEIHHWVGVHHPQETCWTKTRIEWVHDGFQWMRPIGWNPQLSGCAPYIGNLLDKDYNEWVQSVIQWMRPIGWNPQLSGCAPSSGNLLDEDHNWVGAPGSAMDETYWMKSTTEWVCTIHRKQFGWRPTNPLNGCAPWFSNGWDPLDENPNRVTKTLNHKTGNMIVQYSKEWGTTKTVLG